MGGRAPWEVRRVDQRRVIFVNGEPLFAILAQYRDCRAIRDEGFVKRLRRLGFNCLVAPVGWPERADLSGEWRRYLGDVLRACAQARMALILMPNMLGAPKWFWERHPDHPRPPKGHPRRACFPPPNCPHLRAEFARWMRALHGFVNSHPCGEWVVGYTALIGGEGDVDWELYRFRTWLSDPEFLGAWHEWLKRRYGSVSALNAAWGTSFRNLSEIPAPKRSTKKFDFSRPWLDWVEFLDSYGLEQAEWQARLMKRLSPRKLVMIRWSWPLCWLSVNPWLLLQMPHIDIVQCKDATYREEVVRGVGGVAGRWRVNMACEFSIGRAAGKVVLPEMDIAQKERGRPVPFPSAEDVLRDIPLWSNYAGGQMFYALYKVRPENERAIREAARRAKEIMSTSHPAPKVAFLCSMAFLRAAKFNPSEEAGRFLVSFLWSRRTAMQLVSDALSNVKAPPCPPPTPRLGMVSEHNLEDLSLYEAVFVPAGMEVMARATAEALERFVRGGGKVICFGPAGGVDERGGKREGGILNFLPAFPLGTARGEMSLTFEGGMFRGMGNLDLSDLPFKWRWVLRLRGGAKVWARFDDGSPAVVVNRSERSAILAFDPGPVYIWLLRRGDKRARKLTKLVCFLLRG